MLYVIIGISSFILFIVLYAFCKVASKADDEIENLYRNRKETD